MYDTETDMVTVLSGANGKDNSEGTLASNQNTFTPGNGYLLNGLIYRNVISGWYSINKSLFSHARDEVAKFGILGAKLILKLICQVANLSIEAADLSIEVAHRNIKVVT